MKYNCKIIIFYSFRRAKIVFKSKIIRKKDKIFCSKIYINYLLLVEFQNDIHGNHFFNFNLFF